MLNGIIKSIRCDGYWCIETDSEKDHLKVLWIGRGYHPYSPDAHVGDAVICTYNKTHNGALWFARLVQA